MQDNQALRALFSLPPIQASTSTALTLPETPAPKVVTGDRELDAVLWLRECIKTGHAALIAQALEAFKKIKTPAKVLEDRYCDHLRLSSGGNPFAVIFGGMGFADLEELASSSSGKLAKRHDAVARFGSIDNLFNETPAEAACKKALNGLKRPKTKYGWHEYDADKADARFAKYAELLPHTLADCIHAMEFSNTLYRLRQACADNAGDHWPAFQEHDDFCFRSLARIAPQSKEEALAVLEYLEREEAEDRVEVPAILRNLISGGWA